MTSRRNAFCSWKFIRCIPLGSANVADRVPIEHTSPPSVIMSMEMTAFHPANARGYDLSRLIDGLLDASINRCAQSAVQMASFQRYLHHWAARRRPLGAARLCRFTTPRRRRKAVRRYKPKTNQFLNRCLKCRSEISPSMTSVAVESIRGRKRFADSILRTSAHA
jgi:hypothetical protein